MYEHLSLHLFCLKIHTTAYNLHSGPTVILTAAYTETNILSIQLSMCSFLATTPLLDETSRSLEFRFSEFPLRCFTLGIKLKNTEEAGSMRAKILPYRPS